MELITYRPNSFNIYIQKYYTDFKDIALTYYKVHSKKTNVTTAIEKFK